MPQRSRTTDFWPVIPSMKKYISYLIKDLQLGQQKAYSSVIDAFAYSHPLRRTVVAEYTIAQFLDIATSAFPPPNKLNNAQLSAVVKEMKQTLQMLRLHVHFPQELPLSRQYVLLRQIWERPIQLDGHKKQYLDFCVMEPSECPYGEDHCYCHQTPEDWDTL